MPENQLPENQLLELQSCHLNCGNMSRDGLIHIVFNKVLVIRLEEVNLIMKELLEDLHMSVPNLANMLRRLLYVLGELTFHSLNLMVLLKLPN